MTSTVLILCMYILHIFAGLTVIKKHYLKLCSCLPPNYKKTIQKLRNLTDLSEEDVILILNLTEGQPTDPVAVNQRIVMHLLMNCQSHSDLLTVCSVLEELVEPLEQMRVHEFHRGKIIVYIYILYKGTHTHLHAL